MKNLLATLSPLTLLCGLGVIGLSPQVAASPILTAVTHTASATDGTTSTEYFYTEHGSPRTGFYWTWSPVSEQSTSSNGTALLNASTGTIASAGTFYQPTYSASSLASNTFTDTAKRSKYTVNLQATAILTTPQISHMAVSVETTASDTLTFHLAKESDVTLTVKGNATGLVEIIDPSAGDIIFSSGGGSSFHDTLSAGDYEVIGNLRAIANQDTETGFYFNLGTQTQALSYTWVVTTPQ